MRGDKFGIWTRDWVLRWHVLCGARCRRLVGEARPPMPALLGSAQSRSPLIDGRVAALDLNPAMLAVASELLAVEGAPIEWVEGNAQVLAFRRGEL
jgi:hypothetical protein